MFLLVEVPLEAVEDVVRGSDACLGGGLRGSDRAIARPTQEDHLTLTGRHARGNQVLDEAVVVDTVGSGPFDVHDVVPEAGEVGHADESPFGGRPAVHEHGLGIVAQQVPSPLRRDVSRIAHVRESSISGWGRVNTPSSFRPRARRSTRTRTWYQRSCRSGRSRWPWPC